MPTRRPLLPGALTLLALAIPGGPAAAAEVGNRACDATGATPVFVAGVDDRFDLLLGDGRVTTISGLAFDASEAQPDRVAQWLSGLDLLMTPITNAPDRWGRIRSRIYERRSDGVPVDVGRDAIGRGLARYRPDADSHACRDALLRAEADARRAGAGLWADPSAIIDAADRAAVAAAPPDFVVVEGKVASVGATRGRVYLNLGKMRTVDLAIVILGHDIPAFGAQGFELRGLAGRRIRARGLIDRRFGPRMEIGSPDALEIFGADATDARTNEAGR